MRTITGKISGINAPPMSSVMLLGIGDEWVPCETRLALNAISNIAEDLGIDSVLGLEVVATVDESGVLAHIAPTQEEE